MMTQKAIANNDLRFTICDLRFKNLESKIFLLFIAYCSLLIVFVGCASTKAPEMSKIQLEAADLNQSGVKAAAAGKYAHALALFQRALQLNTIVDNQKEIAVNLLNVGRLYLLMERFDDARTVFDKALKAGIRLNDQLVISEGYASLGRYYYLTGSNKDALDVLEKGIATDRREGYVAIVGKLNIVGAIYKDSDKLEDAEKAFNDALESNKGYGMAADAADSLRGLGDVLTKRGNYKMAREFYENALAIDKKIGKGSNISLDLHSLGILSLKENDAGNALDFFLRAYGADKGRGDNKRVLSNLDKIIEIYRGLGDENNAEIYSLERDKLLQKEIPPKKEGAKHQ